MAATSINFTKAALDGLVLPPQGIRSTVHDSKTTGLQLRVTANGTKTFSVYRRTKGGQPERVTLGKYPEMTIDQARRLASKVNSEIEEGSNPAAVKRAVRGELKFSDLFDSYFERYSKIHKKSSRDDEARYRHHLARPFGSKRISEVTRHDLALMHSKLTAAGHPTHANRVLALVSAIFGWAISVGLAETNPARGIRRNRERSRDRFLQSDELPNFFRALSLEPNEALRDFVLLALLTGARRSNVLSMAWNDVSFERAEWRIHETKNGTPQTVTLSPEAISVLKARKPAYSATFVFPSHSKSGHLEEPKKGWNQLLTRMQAVGYVDELARLAEWGDEKVQGAFELITRNPEFAIQEFAEEAGRFGVKPDSYLVRDLRIHDLRRTLGSWQAKTGASLVVIGKSLNHKNVATTQIYARLDQDPVRASIQRATEAMFATSGKHFSLYETKENTANTFRPPGETCLGQVEGSS